jgi:hypothetical protein
MGIKTPHPLPFGAAGSPHEKHISTALLSPTKSHRSTKAPRVIDPPSLLGLLQVLKDKRWMVLLTISLESPLSINARQEFGRE